ncbi:MAG: hypothetical protein KZQ94_07465 [Candidatus Thiodiazotropha sp. (ex Troendleina suluensis)]|nr:hypothetical protein [Candidatus Thiodiazotropha sp. (ex Troendleina suluensis)]
MRFPQLKIGQQFDYQGKRYTKTGLLTASEEGTGTNAMIRRSAEVALLEGSKSEGLAKESNQSFSREEVIELCQEYRSKLTKELDQIADGDGTIQLDILIAIVSELTVFDSMS